MPHVDLAQGAAHGFFERAHNAPFPAMPTLGNLRSPAPAKTPGAAPRTAEDLLKEIAEAGAAELEFGVVAGRTTTAKSLAATETAGAGRRPEFRAGFPVRAKLVELPALGGIAEHFVGFVD